jgi:hypothetical protein
MESVCDLNRDTSRGRSLFAIRKTDEGEFVWVLETVGGDFWREMCLKGWGTACDRCRQHRSECEVAGQEFTLLVPVGSVPTY